MTIIVNSLDARLAARIRTERESRDWSIADLAERSSVSKAMISKIERAEASPTASLLGKLSGAFGLTLSTLLARAEQSGGRLARKGDQPGWEDPATGFRRKAVSPAGAKTVEIVLANCLWGKIAYPAAAFTFIDQQILALTGTLTFIEGANQHDLSAGDCLALGPPCDCTFENRSQTACTYLVIVARRE
jgi:transcriptional regulator with XRE-family HTH domain